MRVCIVTPFLNEYPNAMASAEKMAQALSQVHQVTVYTSCTYQAARHEQLEQVTIERLPAWYIPEPANYVFTRGLVRSLWRRRDDFDIYIINKYMWPMAWTIIPLKLWGKKVIVTTDAFQGFDWWSWSRLVNAVMWLYAHTIGTIILHLANQVVLYHEGLEARARALGLRYQVIHNGIDPSQFLQAQPATDIIKQPDEVVITYIGRLDRIKGYLDVLTVAQRVCRQSTTIRFLIVGNTAGRAAIVQQYQSDRIQFTGVRQDIPNILAASDIVVLPTYGDGLPNVIMEAMAAGRPCIASNINGLPYLIDHERTGLLLEPGDLNLLEHHIMRLVEQPALRQQYGQAGREKILEQFNWQKLVKQYTLLFTSL
ncbi:MAG: glycosyltransferase family 4 protein [Candidatus Kerfeldbacteria bacterium]|nr:glycosyltransferase family 4 protein [Candidatus Kerfeldbacteria bacterium]